MIKVIFLADIVGKIGRQAVKQQLPKLRKQYHPDLIVANVENLAHGIGFTKKTLAEMSVSGVDFFTSGNHAWKKAGSDEILNDSEINLVRPANYSARKSGVGFKEVKIGSNKLIVVNLLGRVFIPDKTACPFKTMEKILKKIKKGIFLVDFHAEATSEKVAFARYFDGQVAAVIGTHTHVPTADEQILPAGTGYITDAGMIGYKDSVIGANPEQIFNLFLGRGRGSKKHDLPEFGRCQLNGVYLEIDTKTKKIKKITRINKIIKV
ncbi:MAG: TIGR00282 family metallophosphoesterase [Patescibacteria group bacterium]